MTGNIKRVFDANINRKFELYQELVNPLKLQFIQKLGFERYYTRGEGCYLFDREGQRYLDCDAGNGVFCLGRNHPYVKDSIREMIDMDYPGMVNHDASLFASLVSRILSRHAGDEFGKTIFTSSGSETTEASLKLARGATGNSKLLYLQGDYHGTTFGALSVTDTGEKLKSTGTGLGPMLPGCHMIPGEDIESLAMEFQGGDVAGLIIEIIQGSTVTPHDRQFIRDAADLCKQHGATLIADEVFTGLGRTGRFASYEYYDIHPDMVLFSKALSGGFVPVGALLVSHELFAAACDRAPAVIHGSTFGENEFGVLSTLATLEVIDRESLVSEASRKGHILIEGFRALQQKYDMIKEVRGQGLLIGLELRAPKGMLKGILGRQLEKKGLLGLLFLVQLMDRHNILTSHAGRNNIIRFHPPLNIPDTELDVVLHAVEDVIKLTYRFPEGIGKYLLWCLKQLAG